MTKKKLTEDSTPTATPQSDDKKDMLSAIEFILHIAEDSALDKETMGLMDSALEYVAELQDITTNQALMLAIIMECSTYSSFATLSDIAKFLDCKAIRAMQYQKDIDELERRKMVKKARYKYANNQYGYTVSEEMIEAMKYDRRFVPKSLKAKDGLQFLQYVARVTKQRKNDAINTEQLQDNFQELLESNADLHYVKVMEKLDLSINSQLLLTHMACCLVLDRMETVTGNSLSFLFDKDEERFCELRSLEDGNHILMKKKVVEFDGTDDFIDTERYKLTNLAKKKLLKGIPLPKKKNETDIDVLKAESIVTKELFFDEEVGRQMEDLSELLTVDKLSSIQSRLREHGRRTGFACLFYGSPGTGKTESALQLAHKTGRDIMQVDMSAIKSKWVGESEQNIKAVFDDYRSLCKTSKNTPILLFNEADAILGRRMENAQHATDIMNNSIQNIILQEMETLDGIMIATTNLEGNLDNAFERRFIYKVRFNRPSVELRQKIWQSMLPTISDNTALQLANEYDFSGGQIENIARKCDVESILYGESAVNADKIMEFCKMETITKQATRIGFM